MHRGALLGQILVACLLLPGAASAGMDFGRISALATTAGADTSSADDRLPSIATDGAGVWIAVWSSHDSGLGVCCGGAVYSRSVDDAATWSAPAPIRPETANDAAGLPIVVTDGGGRWVAAWSPGARDIVVSVSDDDGLSWSVPSTIISATASGDNHSVQLATDSAGTWLLVWESKDDLGGTIGGDEDILFSRSTDNGTTWSAPAALNTDAAVDPGVEDFQVRVASGGAGTWVAVWDGSPGVDHARSTDGGATWSAPVSFGPGAAFGTENPDIASDGSGGFVVVWDVDGDTRFARSTDAGASWTPEAQIHPYLAVDKGGSATPRIAWLGTGLWSAVWLSNDDLRGTTSEDTGMRISTSRDDGQTWSSPASPVRRSKSGPEVIDLHQTMATSAAGTTVLLWSSDDTLGDTIGSDRDILTATSRRDCPTVAREDCRTPTRSRGSRIKLKDAVGGNDRLSWSWKYGQETTDADLGDPSATDSYVLCLYEQVGGSPGLVSEWDLRAAETCRGLPCWTVQTGEVEYKDRNLEQGSVNSLKIRSGAEGQAAFRLKAKGPGLALPGLPLSTSPAVRIQLTNLGTNVCWDGTHAQATKNDATQFKSASD